MSRTRAETLENLRSNNIEPQEDFLDDFTKFSQSTQDNLIETFKKYPNIESRYKFIDRRII
jgi:hypothetical protein|tara:strand:+ start:281 stop:463 length:183 start_codon:yes stop_codon:yes gene_type:complete